MKPIAIAIKAIPDVETGRRLHNIQNLSDAGVAKAMLHLHQQKTASDNLPVYLQKVLVIALVRERNGKLDSTVLSGERMNESQLLKEYLRLSQGKQQIAWNGQVFEYALLQYRLFKHNIKLIPDFSRCELTGLLNGMKTHCQNHQSRACRVRTDRTFERDEN